MEPIKLIKDTIDRTDIAQLNAWLSQYPTPQLTKGPFTVQYEQQFANEMGMRHAIMVNSGSSALLLSLYALKSVAIKEVNGGRGISKIAVCALSWATDVAPCVQFGIDMCFVDCDLQTLCPDIKHLENVFKTEQPDAFLLVSPLGLVPDMDSICALCERYGVLLIEDICESLGSTHKGRNLGNYGMVSVCSTYMGHHISTIEGGIIFTNNTTLYNVMVAMRSHGWNRDLAETTKENISKAKMREHRMFQSRLLHKNVLQKVTDPFEGRYTFYLPGFNLRSTDVSAFLGLLQLKKLEEFVRQRQLNFMYYQKHIKTKYKIKVAKHHFVSNLGYPVLSHNKQKITQALDEAGIECRPLIAGNIVCQPFVWQYYSHWETQTPNATKVSEIGFYLPNHPYLTKQEMDRVIGIVNRFEK